MKVFINNVNLYNFSWVNLEPGFALFFFKKLNFKRKINWVCNILITVKLEED